MIPVASSTTSRPDSVSIVALPRQARSPASRSAGAGGLTADPSPRGVEPSLTHRLP
jgi:hypothetical protein